MMPSPFQSGSNYGSKRATAILDNPAAGAWPNARRYLPQCRPTRTSREWNDRRDRELRLDRYRRSCSRRVRVTASVKRSAPPFVRTTTPVSEDGARRRVDRPARLGRSGWSTSEAMAARPGRRRWIDRPRKTSRLWIQRPRIRFAPDSPLEGDGFEPLVPGPRNARSRALFRSDRGHYRRREAPDPQHQQRGRQASEAPRQKR